jgi:hypothetical protein
LAFPLEGFDALWRNAGTRPEFVEPVIGRRFAPARWLIQAAAIL